MCDDDGHRVEFFPTARCSSSNSPFTLSPVARALAISAGGELDYVRRGFKTLFTTLAPAVSGRRSTAVQQQEKEVDQIRRASWDTYRLGCKAETMSVLSP